MEASGDEATPSCTWASDGAEEASGLAKRGAASVFRGASSSRWSLPSWCAGRVKLLCDAICRRSLPRLTRWASLEVQPSASRHVYCVHGLAQRVLAVGAVATICDATSCTRMYVRSTKYEALPSLATSMCSGSSRPRTHISKSGPALYRGTDAKHQRSSDKHTWRNTQVK